MMVGDWKDDIGAGTAAGCLTCLKELGEDAQRHNAHLVPLASCVVRGGWLLGAGAVYIFSSSEGGEM